MSGINGIYSAIKIDHIENRVDKMNNAIAHRGMDASKILVVNEGIAFGYRRLSTINIGDRPNQPLTSNSGRWTIVFDGAIYNYKELKEDSKYDLSTSYDAEVILAYIENYGLEAFLNDSNGIYAIGLYDKYDDKLYIVRDKLGVKPIYYAVSNNSFIFSSEIKGILSSGLVEAEFNEDAIDEYLGNRYVRAPYTFFKNIFQLEAGCIMMVNQNLALHKTVYWELPTEFNYEQNYEEEKIVKDFKVEIINSISRSLAADAPVGTYLSGGVDSSLITAITSNLLNERINTYIIGFNDLNEFDYANMVASKYNTRHHQIVMEEDKYFDLIGKVISYKDAPLGVPNEVLLTFLSRIIKQDVTVLLSGEGADELLGGYGKIFRSPFDYFYEEEKHNIMFYDYFINKYEYVPRDIRDKYLNTKKTLRETFDNSIGAEFEKNRNEENVFRFFHKYHVKGLLQRIDTTTMLEGIEARVPFLDHELVEYAYKNIPYSLKLKWKDHSSKEKAKKLSSNVYSEELDIPKYILKKISYDFLPKEVIERKKMGFPVPLNEWIKKLEEEAKQILKDAYWFKVDRLDEMILEAKKDVRTGQIIWMFINIELFRKKYFDKSWLW
ncbi:asparagine synthase (glutamine-hydrolysing) [Proteiniborus ethanoligenes]|uniref:asparagine synthase (glutamine-hydrolyzing) n=1 Tax=Proteiniborus ethanoligenes TaxID=415015 RepID=A0A1H3S3Z8_9FIRM|nr:asparagine synthase (glutamine-hydrolyzing) [Proteiniborus ethanoligenes]SDZ32746.1 asparagine synthase (glutamine-hydrolysing) [Proteiniborus ethanoligenes]